MTLKDAEPVVEMPAPPVRERLVGGANGFAVVGIGGLVELASSAGMAFGVVLLVQGRVGAGLTLLVISVLLALAALLMLAGLTQVAPGEARVLQLFGRYTGTIRATGLRWVNPFTTRRKVSTRIRNHETAVLKVNDADGNPIEIAVVVVWQVEDTAQASFAVEDFVQFVSIQTEAAVRHIANGYPYDAHGDGQLSLRDNADEITEKLSAEIAVRVSAAGVQSIESRITHLAYAPEIAQAMLRRQQAGAVVAARRRIVDGAVGMVEQALERLADQEIVELDEERKAAMVSNLMVVLCGDRDVQPVVNTGSLYQ
jgi:regulator of protease activity HflC (stomatin/prohibitin superfamily)